MHNTCFVSKLSRSIKNTLSEISPFFFFRYKTLLVINHSKQPLLCKALNIAANLIKTLYRFERPPVFKYHSARPSNF